MKVTTITNTDEYGRDIFCYCDGGTCRLSISYNCTNVIFFSNLVVDESCRNRGIGNALLEEAEKIGRNIGCNVITLDVKYNSWMREWYERKGYIPVRYFDSDEYIVMSKFLT